VSRALFDGRYEEWSGADREGPGRPLCTRVRGREILRTSGVQDLPELLAKKPQNLVHLGEVPAACFPPYLAA
jgi:hypothetical protein